MGPRIVSRDAFLIVGMPYVGKNENNEIPAMFDRFMSRVPEIGNRGGRLSEFYGLCTMPEGLEPGAFEYVAGVEVCSFADIPEGLVGRKVPAQTYAVVRAETLSELGTVWKKAYEEWLPEAGLEPVCGVEFEYYDESFDPEKAGPIDIYIPIKR